MRALEEGCVLLFPQLRFVIEDDERYLLSPATAAKSKNISWDVATGKLGGSSLGESATSTLRTMMTRFAKFSRDLMLNLFPPYAPSLTQARTSFRPVEILGRTTSWRKDDTRLHVDSFPSSPVQDRRILRVFCNVNPDGRGHYWRLGESFPSVASRFLPSLSPPCMGDQPVAPLVPDYKKSTKPIRPFHAAIARPYENGLGLPVRSKSEHIRFPSGQHMDGVH